MIRDARQKLGLSQMALAIECGVDVRTVRRWEKGHPPSSLARVVLEAVLGIPLVRRLFREEGAG